jgi:hypothetical protein
MHVQLHMLVVIFIIRSLMLAKTIAELTNTHQTYTHLHMLLYPTLCPLLRPHMLKIIAK